jgi:hypothetical protein
MSSDAPHYDGHRLRLREKFRKTGLEGFADPLAELAVSQQQLLTRLAELTPVESPDLRTMWQAAAQSDMDSLPEPNAPDRGNYFAHQFYVLITCRDEKHQVELLQRFQKEGLTCEAKLC